jgi:hypothetical protein
MSDTATIRVVDPTALSAGSGFGTRHQQGSNPNPDG